MLEFSYTLGFQIQREMLINFRKSFAPTGTLFALPPLFNNFWEFQNLLLRKVVFSKDGTTFVPLFIDKAAIRSRRYHCLIVLGYWQSSNKIKKISLFYSFGIIQVYFPWKRGHDNALLHLKSTPPLFIQTNLFINFKNLDHHPPRLLRPILYLDPQSTSCSAPSKKIFYCQKIQGDLFRKTFTEDTGVDIQKFSSDCLA